MIAEGRNINVTLIFSLDRYHEVMDAYLDGLEAYAATDGADLSTVASVASFFISRVDTEVDRRLEAIGTPEALALRGKAAVAQGKLAYRLFAETFSGPRWEALAARGAQVQRPLWASTSTKNPAYPDTLYVDELIGPDTVNTLPDATIEAFADHGTLARRVDADVDAGRRPCGTPSPTSASTSTTSPPSSSARAWPASRRASRAARRARRQGRRAAAPSTSSATENRGRPRSPRGRTRRGPMR